jgi:hypothetical protein
MKRWLHALLAALALDSAVARAATELPVYVEESHAGSFYFLAGTLPLDEPHTLILVDAHTDASGIAASDEIRAAMRRGPTREIQAELFAQLRKSGRIQCYDWLEPLMPAPVAEVFWVSAPLLPESQRAELERTAREQLDGHQEALPRDCGLLAEKYHARDLRGLTEETARWPRERAVVASIDLDYFAAMPAERLEAAMDQVLGPILKLPGLRAVTFCVSSPWQPSAEHAERLVFLALDAVLRVPRARLRIEPFGKCGPDKSLQAQEITARGGAVPVFDFTKAGPALRSLLAAHWRPEMTLTEPAKMEQAVAQCRNDPFLPRVVIPQKLTAPEGDWHFTADEIAAFSAQIAPEPVGANVRWQAIVPSASRQRIMDGPWPYAEGAPRWLRWKVQPLHTGAELPLTKLLPLLHPPLHSGTVKLRAEVVRDGESHFSAPVTVRVKAQGAEGFRAALSEAFGLPYVFGSTFLTATAPDGTHRGGAECGEGTDCANFLSAAFRAEGWRTPWGSVADLRAALMPWPDSTRFPPDAPQRGLMLDFGPHAAALWEDRAPLGELNDDDICVHQLEGPPELIALGKLREDRPAPRLFEPDRAAEAGPRLVFGGDVMLARTVRDRLVKGEPVLAPLRPYFKDATVVVNLECAVTAEQGGGFRAPPLAATALRELGVDAVSLANNHAGDAGAAGLTETAKALSAAKVQSFGHTTEPLWLAIPGSATFSLFGWDQHGNFSAAALAEHIRAANNPIVFAHWGVEHSRVPTPEQRAAARTFIEAGARMIIGAGPHAMQPLEWMGSVPVAWSLGNLVFDDKRPDAEWRRGALLEVTLSQSGGIVRGRLREVPVVGGPVN